MGVLRVKSEERKQLGRESYICMDVWVKIKQNRDIYEMDEERKSENE